jgi:hypothetical protein
MATHTKAYSIKNQWLNMSLYFINFMYNTKKPFADSVVGKVLKSNIVTYGKYFYNSTLIFTPIGLLVTATRIVAEQTLVYFGEIYGDFKNDGKYVCHYITTPDRLKDNNELMGGGQRNSKWLANGDYINTNFIKLDKTDIISFFEKNDTGFAIRKKELNGPNNFMRNPNNSGNITNQERDDLNTTVNNNNEIIYILKGTNSNDIIRYSIITNTI